MAKPFVISAIQYLLLATVFLIPIFSVQQLAYSVIEKTLLFYLLTEFTFGLWLYAIIKNRAYLPTRNNLLIASIIFLALYVLAGVLAADPAAAFWSTMSRMSGIVSLLHVAAFTLMLVSTIKDDKNWRTLFVTVAVSGALVALPSYATLWSGDESFTKSTFGNDSYTAAYLTFAFFLALILAVRSKTKTSMVSFAAIAASIILSPLFIDLREIFNLLTSPTLVIGTARAAAASIVLGLLLASLSYFSSFKNKLVQVSGKYAFIIATVLLVVLSTMIFVPGSSVQQKVADVGLGSRLVFWESAVAGLQDRPVLGYGPENYYVPFYKHFESALLTQEYYFELYSSKPHSTYIEILVSGGVLSFIAYLAIWVVVAFMLWRLWRSGSTSKEEIALMVGLIISYLLQSLVLFDTLSSYMGVGILFAYLIYLSKKEAETYPKIPRGISWPAAATAVGFISVSVYFLTLMPYLQQKELMRIIEDSTVQERADRYDDLFALSPVMRTSVAEYLMNKSLGAVPAMIPKVTPKEKAMLLKDVSSLRQTVQAYAPEEINYRHDLYLARLMLLEFILETDAEKREALMTSVEKLEISLEKLSPQNPQNYWVKAQRQIFEEEGEVALKTLEESNQLVPNIPATTEKIEVVEKYLNKEGGVPYFTY